MMHKGCTQGYEREEGTNESQTHIFVRDGIAQVPGHVPLITAPEDAGAPLRVVGVGAKVAVAVAEEVVEVVAAVSGDEERRERWREILRRVARVAIALLLALLFEYGPGADADAAPLSPGVRW